MRLIVIYLALLIVPISTHAEGGKIYVFGQILYLKGDCKYAPFRKTNPAFVCRMGSDLYTVAFTKLKKSESFVKQLSVDLSDSFLKTEQISSNSKYIGKRHHYRYYYSSNSSIASRGSEQYHVCEALDCVTFTSNSVSIFESLILQLSPEVIEP